MIIDAVVGAISSVVSGLFGLLPTWTLPDFFTSAATVWTMVLSKVGELSAWFPLDTIGTMGVAVFSAVSVSVGIRLVRIVIGYVPTMGGSQQ